MASWDRSLLESVLIYCLQLHICYMKIIIIIIINNNVGEFNTFLLRFRRINVLFAARYTPSNSLAKPVCSTIIS